MAKSEQELEQGLQEDFVNLFIKAGSHAGTHIYQTIKAILFLEPGPLCLEEIAKRAQYSLSATSMALKPLVELGVVERVHVPGSRKTYFQMHKDFFRLVKSSLDQTIVKSFSAVLASVPGLLDKYKQAAASPNNRRLKQEYVILRNYHEQLKAFERIFKDFLHAIDKQSTGAP